MARLLKVIKRIGDSRILNWLTLMSVRGWQNCYATELRCQLVAVLQPIDQGMIHVHKVYISWIVLLVFVTIS